MQGKGRWRTDAYALAILLCFAAAVFWPLLFGGMMATEAESVGGYYPWAFYYANALAHGTSPLWNPSYYGGFATYLNQFGGFLYPVNALIFSVLSPVIAEHVASFIALVVGLFFAYLCGRAVNRSSSASVVLALTYLLGQTFLSFTTGISYAISFMVLPIILLAVLYAQRARSWRGRTGAIVLGGLGLSAVFLAGFSQSAFYGIILLGCYVFFRISK